MNPTNGKPILSIQEALENDVDVAVDAARAAYKYGSEWRMMPPAGRGALLCKLADLFERDLETLAQIESLDNGKPMMLARGDVGYAAACFRYYGGWADKVSELFNCPADQSRSLDKQSILTHHVLPTPVTNLSACAARSSQ